MLGRRGLVAKRPNRLSAGRAWKAALGTATTVGCYYKACKKWQEDARFLPCCHMNSVSGCGNAAATAAATTNCCMSLCLLLLLASEYFITVLYSAAACHTYIDSGIGTALSSATGSGAAIATRIIHIHSTVHSACYGLVSRVYVVEVWSPVPFPRFSLF